MRVRGYSRPPSRTVASSGAVRVSSSELCESALFGATLLELVVGRHGERVGRDRRLLGALQGADGLLSVTHVAGALHGQAGELREVLGHLRVFCDGASA